MKKWRLLIAFIVISFVFLMLAFVSAFIPPAPSITVLSPNGGEVWQIGTTQTIKWNSDLVSIPEQPIIYDISLVPYCPSGQICTTLAPFVIAKSLSDLTYNWKVGDTIDSSAPAGSYNIKICQSGTSTCDSSDSYFKITIVISCKMPACEGVYDTGKKDENGCVIYACPTNQTLSCTDSDGGINYYVKGNVSASRGVGFDGTIYDHNPPAIFLDSCFKTVSAPVEESDKVLENYCGEGLRKYIIYSCQNGCKDGACIQTTNATGCNMPACEGAYNTGKKDASGCPIFDCLTTIKCKSGQKIGDLNGDGAINSHDYSIADTTLRKIILGSLPTPKEICCADVNQDGTLTTADIAKINVIAQGLAQSPGVCSIKIRCEDYSYNECPLGCSKINPPCLPCPVSSNNETESTPVCASCRAPYCATPGQKEVYLNQKFELKSQETAKVVDYKNMEIKYIAMLCTIPSCRENEPCPPTPNPCKLTLQVSISSSEGTGTTTSTIDIGTSSSSTGTIGIGSGGSGTSTVGVGRGGVGTVFDLAPGEKKEVFGASISLLKLERDVAVLVVEEQIIIKPVCGNGICEAGEGEICTVPASSSDIFCEEGKECKTPPSKCNLVCPKDCSKGELIYIELNNKFKLQISQAAILKNESIKITFKNMIASRCKEEVVSSKASAVAIKEKVAEAERTLTGSVVSDLSTDKPLSVLRCVGSGPRALLSFEIEREKGNPIKKGVLELDLKEKKQVGDFTVAFLDHDYASRTGVFLINKEKFECPEKCKCDGEGNTIACPDKKTCDESKVLCPDGECRDKCEIKTTEECKYGCNYESSCFPIGVRSKGLYCGNDLVMNSQKNSEQICENNFECSSNVCVSGKCVSAGLMERVLAWFKRMFGKE